MRHFRENSLESKIVRVNANKFHTFIADPQLRLPLASGLAPAAFYGLQPPNPAASLLHHPQYMTNGLAPPAIYGLQQPMYGAYGNTEEASTSKPISKGDLSSVSPCPSAPPQTASNEASASNSNGETEVTSNHNNNTSSNQSSVKKSTLMSNTGDIPKSISFDQGKSKSNNFLFDVKSLAVQIVRFQN